MNILITGGLGFQGAHLARALFERGYRVFVLNTPSLHSRREWDVLRTLTEGSRRIDCIWGSVLDPSVILPVVEGIDVVVHLAAWANPDKCTEQPFQAIETNVIGTQHVVDAVYQETRRCRALGIRPPLLIHGSSCEVYGPARRLNEVVNGREVDDKQLVSQDERSEMHPPSVYAASKCAADRLVNAYVETFKLRALITRPCNVFGPGQRSGRHGGVIPTFVARALAGQLLVVRGGSQTREFLYIDDLVSAFVKLIDLAQDKAPWDWPQYENERVVNLGSGQRVSIGQVAGYVAEMMHIGVEMTDARPGDVSGFNLDSTYAKSLLGVYVLVDFWYGLDAYIAWARSQ